MTTNTKKPDQPSVVDELADDATPAEYPEGAPLLKPYLDIRPRSKRAEFKRKYAEFAGVQADMQKITASGVLGDEESTDQNRAAEQMRVWADMDDYYQLMDDLMAMAAVEPDAYREWSDRVDDAELVAVFQVYAKRSQPGEASRSAT
jgi:hypothetical protein